MTRDWKPGDVAMVRRGTSDWHRALWVNDGDRNGFVCIHGECDPDKAEALVVIDPEDREQVERLVLAWFAAARGHDEPGAERMQDALRSLVAPPKPEVYEHLVTERPFGKDVVLTSLCGKVWTPRPRTEVDVKGRCPECVNYTTAGWVA